MSSSFCPRTVAITLRSGARPVALSVPGSLPARKSAPEAALGGLPAPPAAREAKADRVRGLTPGCCCWSIASSCWYTAEAQGCTAGSWASGHLSSFTVSAATPARMAWLILRTARSTAGGRGGCTSRPCRPKPLWRGRASLVTGLVPAGCPCPSPSVPLHPYSPDECPWRGPPPTHTLKRELHSCAFPKGAEWDPSVPLTREAVTPGGEGTGCPGPSGAPLSLA